MAKVTMQDVAKRAGVSLATVSHVINGTKHIPEPTAERVQAAVAELNYHPHVMARALASNKTKILALIISAVAKDLGPTEIAFIASSTAKARELGYTLVLWPAPHEDPAILQSLIRQGLVDGVLVMEVRLDDVRVTALAKSGLPFVLIGRAENPDDYSYVDIDFDLMVRQALTYLSEQGRKHVALLGHSPETYDKRYGPTVRTLEAFESIASELGMTTYHRPCGDTSMAGREWLSSARHTAPEIDAVLTMNYRATFGLVDLAREQNLLPEQLPIIALMSSPDVAQMTSPALSTLDAPGALLGSRGTEALVGKIQGNDKELVQELIPCTFNLRQTTPE